MPGTENVFDPAFGVAERSMKPGMPMPGEMKT